jgi:predicted amidohydrolase
LVLFVPAAFTAFTGRDHWLPLLRARAIENQCWVVAPAQVGRHGPGRRSHGHTAVLDPWGETVALLERGVGVLAATIDLDRLASVRRGLPCLEHVRRELYRLPGRRF